MSENITSLESLVVRLTGDASNYEKVLNEAASDTETAVKLIEQAAKELEKKQNAALQEAARLTAAVATPTERYAAAVAHLDKFLADGHITQEVYNRHLQQLNAELPETKAAMEAAAAVQKKAAEEQARHNAIMEEGRRVTQSLMSPTEQYQAELARLDALLRKKAITQDVYNRGVRQARQLLPQHRAAVEENTAAEQRAEAIKKSLITEQQQYENRLKELHYLHRRQKLDEDQLAVATRALAKEYDFAGKQARQLQSAVMGLAGAGQSAGLALSIGVTAPLTAAAALSVKQIADVEDALANLKAAAQPTAEQLEQIKEASTAMSRELGVGVQNVISAETELLKAGMSLEDTLGGATQAAVQFAKVGEMDVANAAVVLTDAVNVFGENAQRSADLMSAAADASSISIQDMAQSFAMASAVAGSASQNLEDTAAAIAVLGMNGLKGSDAGTSLKTMLLRLMAPAEQAQKVIEKYGLVLRDSNGEMRPFIELVGEIESKMKGLDSEARDNALLDLFGQDAIRSAQIFLRTGAQGVDEMKEAMQGANTVAEKYSGMMDTLSGDYQKFRSAFGRARGEIGEALSGPLRGMLQWATDYLDKFAAASDQNSALAKTVIYLGTAAASVGPTLTIMSRMAFSANNLVTLFGTLRDSSGAMAGAFTRLGGAAGLAKAGIAGLAIGGIIVLSKAIYDNMPSIKAFNAELERSRELANVVNERMGQQQAETLTSIRATEDPADRHEKATEALKKAEKELAGYNNQVANAQKNVEKLNTWWKWGTGNKELELAKENLKETEERSKAYGKYVQELREELSRLDETQKEAGESAAGIGKKGQKALEKYKEQIAEMQQGFETAGATLGMGKSVAQVEALARKMMKEGIPQSDIEAALKDAREAAAKFDKDEEAFKSSEKLQSDVDALNSKLQEQIDMFGKSGTEAEIYALKLKGASDEQIQALTELSNKLKEKEAAKKESDELDALERKYADPVDKIKEAEAELQRLHESGRYNADQYEKKLAEVRGELEKTARATAGGVEGLAAGSAALVLKFADYQRAAKLADSANKGAAQIADRSARRGRRVARDASDEVARSVAATPGAVGGPIPQPVPEVGPLPQVAPAPAPSVGNALALTDLSDLLEKIEENTRKDKSLASNSKPTIELAPLGG